MGFAYFGLSRGMSWGTFWLILCGMFFYMIWAVLYAPTASEERGVIPDAKNAAPTEAIEAVMADFESQGYLVEHTKDLEQDPDNVQRVIIEYVVTKWDESESWTYTWAWEVPVPLTSMFGVREMDQEIYERQFQLCRLIPLSESAIAIQENVDQYILQTQAE